MDEVASRNVVYVMSKFQTLTKWFCCEVFEVLKYKLSLNSFHDHVSRWPGTVDGVRMKNL